MIPLTSSTTIANTSTGIFIICSYLFLCMNLFYVESLLNIIEPTVGHISNNLTSVHQSGK